MFCDFAASACCGLAGFRFSGVKMVVWWVCWVGGFVWGGWFGFLYLGGW